MEVVADTSAFLAVALREPEREAIITATHGCGLIAPDVLPYEMGNALSALVRRGRLQPDEALVAWDAALAIPVELQKTSIRNSLAIATAYNIYAYDAYFLESSLHLRCPLLTLDRRLKEVALQAGARILEVAQR